jgi:hypothetical protein
LNISSSSSANNVFVKLANAAIVVVVLAACAFGYSRCVAECLWGHLLSGVDISAAGHALTQDHYSYLSDLRWIDHEWLFEMILATCFKVSGLVGVAALKLGLVELLIALLMVYFLRNKLPILWCAALTILTAAMLAPVLYAPRPHLFSLVLFAASLMLLQAAESHTRRWLLLLPLLIIPWCNLHGGFVSGLGIICTWCLADAATIVFYKRNWSALREKTIWFDGLIVALCFGASLVNPFGWALLVLLKDTLSVTHPEFVDWHPINIATPLGASYLAAVLIAILLLYLSPRKKSWSSLCVLFIAAIQPLAALRHFPFAILAIVIICAPHIAAFLRTRSMNFGTLERFPNWFNVTLASACALGTIALLSTAGKLLGTVSVDQLPLQAVSVIKNSGFKGNLAAPFECADFCLWHLYPQVKTALDWRRGTVFSNTAQTENMAFTYGEGRWDDLLRNHPTDAVLTSKLYASYNLMKLSPGWKQCYADDQYAIFARTGSVAEEELSTAKPTPQVQPF